MAYVVRARGRRYEIRESRTTSDGPRSRTLASFVVLDDSVLEAARSRAVGSIDDSAVRRAARRIGAPVADAPADAAARRLLGELAAGRLPTPALESLLRRFLDASDQTSPGDMSLDTAQWVDADDEQRGRALVELMELGDRIPTPKRGPLAGPRLAPPGT